MPTRPCPACRYPNEATARRCGVCGVALVEGDTVPLALSRFGPSAGDVNPAASALWIDEMPSPPTPRGGAGVAVPQLPGVTLREIVLPAHAPQATRSPPERGADSAPDSASPPVARTAASPAPLAVPKPLPGDRAARAAIKVARRAAVRRDRLASAAASPGASDVLVMDGNGNTRNELDDQLRALGFRVRPVATLGQAALLAGFHPFAAVFVAVPPGAVDGAVHDLFERARGVCHRLEMTPAVRVLVAAHWSPEDRVRAQLAGCEATLVPPLTLRDVARVLDANGVALPNDPRHG